jgi:hypothetical protein
VCEKEPYLVALIRYIHLNPVRAKLVGNPEQYTYSGHAAYLTGQATAVLDPSAGLGVFGGRGAYRRFVLEGMDEGHQAGYYAAEDQRFLGTERFVTQMRGQEQAEPPRRSTRSLASALKAVAAAMEVDPAMLKSLDRSWAVSRQRTLAAYILVRRKGYGVGEVAAQLGRDVATMSVLLSRFGDRVEREPSLRRTVEQVGKTVKI